MKGLKKPKPTISRAQIRKWRDEALPPRTFGGKKYRYVGYTSSKRERDIEILNQKRAGNLYRVIKKQRGLTNGRPRMVYLVYSRPKHR